MTKNAGSLNEDYEAHTRRLYQNAEIARQYAAAYEGPFRLTNLSQKLVAQGERRAIRALLSPIAGDLATVADLPCGTGKLHGVLAGFPFRIIAADVSREMLRIGAAYYAGIQSRVRAVRLDATLLPFGDQSVDGIVCLRLLHRVPASIKVDILAELTRVARRHVLVSLGIAGAWQRFRLRVRRSLTGAETVPYPVAPGDVDEYLSIPGWTLTGRVSVLPVLSAEIVYRLSRQAI